MTDKDLKRMSRGELLELLIAQMNENEKLKRKLTKAQEYINDRQITISEAGSIAEAALSLNAVFEAAQNAAAQYLDNIKRLSGEQEAICKQMEDDARKKAEAYDQKVRSEADAYSEMLHKEADEYGQKVRSEADAYKQKVASEADAYKETVSSEANAYKQKTLSEADAYKQKVRQETDHYQKQVYEKARALISAQNDFQAFVNIVEGNEIK